MDDGKGGSYPIELAVRLFTAFDFAIFNYAVCAGRIYIADKTNYKRMLNFTFARLAGAADLLEKNPVSTRNGLIPPSLPRVCI